MRRARSWVITCGSLAKQHHRHGDHGHPSDYQDQCPRHQDALGSFRPPLTEPTGDPNRNDALGVALGVVIKLFGLAVIGLIDWLWWGSSGRAGLAGVAWHIKIKGVLAASRRLAWLGDRLRVDDRAPRPVVVALVAGCFLVWVGMAVGALDFLGVVDAD